MTALWAVVPAAGSGSRMASSEPKQFLKLHGRSLLEWSVAALLRLPELRLCMVALPEAAAAAEARLFANPRVARCAGGDTRAASVAAGLAALPAAETDWVLVHDAARPCLPQADLERLVQRVTASTCGALLAQPVTDTLKREGPPGRVAATVEREGLWRAQTPQMFRVGELRAALETAKERRLAVTDEASAMELAGHVVQLVEGSADNLKVTYPRDLVIAEVLLARGAGSGIPGQGSGARDAAGP